jgi:hypothetical protein
MMAHDCNESYLVYVSVFSLFGAMGIPRQAAALSDSEGSPKRGWKCRPVSILKSFFLSYLLYLNKSCCQSASFLSSVYLTLAAESERMDFGSPVLNFLELQL